MTDSSTPPGGFSVDPEDKRYPSLSRGFNQRWLSTPEYIRTVTSSEDTRNALQTAFDETPSDPGRTRITARSGGHCYEDFVCAPDVRVILDLSPLCGMYWDGEMRAQCVEAGATNWHTYSHLYPATGRALPGGTCYSVGLGGHITGGGYGMLSRKYGLTVDYLYAVEVAVVDEQGTARLVTARIDDPDPWRKALAWAHTGGGGGNFGIVTRFWFRDVPEPPSSVMLCGLEWKWSDFKNPGEFHALLNAYGRYFQQHQDHRTVEGSLFTLLKLNHRSNGKIGLIAQIDADDRIAGDRAITEFLDTLDGAITPAAQPLSTAMGEHPPLPTMKTPQYLPWLTATQTLNASGENLCGKYKSAYIREPFTPEQITAMWDCLGNTRFTEYTNPSALIQIDSYGAAVNRAEFTGMRTAVQQRDSIMKMQYQVYWPVDEEEKEHLDWIRETYTATFAATHGVPAVSTGQEPRNTDGCYINYPDADLPDGRPDSLADGWPTLYYKDAYPALRRVKRHWDPRNVFRHQQSVEPAEHYDPGKPPLLP
ncbi:BBE domain-containing protein [Streptomyces sp. HNM0574]|uniref:FAD-binding oxidoreductase n=1 Tax=Streptomyces sp. HNM0574 TaxID=2714954 RepID=UPI00146E9BE4|nr:BBE domain-containing protein [Streptomyces sp. HNM0574]NLU70744.1 FAD-binding oxidoreductase [Streptomyces sp. HNM0574]